MRYWKIKKEAMREDTCGCTHTQKFVGMDENVYAEFIKK